MNNNNVFGKAVVDTANRKREKFPLNFQNSTSMDFGEVQPLCCRLLKPQSHTTMNGKHLVRLDPMVAPSVGSIKQKTWHHFVGMSELTRKFSALLTKSTVTGAGNNQFFVPLDLIYAATSDISALCLIGADYSVYVWDPVSPLETSADASSSRWTLDDNSDSSQRVQDLRSWLNTYVFMFNHSESFFPGFTGGYVNLRNLLGPQFAINAILPCGREDVSEFLNRPYPFDAGVDESGYSEVDLGNADYVVRNSIVVGNNSYEISVAIRLSAMGKRIRKILIGCGYRINFLQSKNRSLMPLFAFYKAYFDTFGLTLWQSWESTVAKLILERFDSNVQYQFGLDSTSVNDQLFMRFAYDLGCCYATEEYDYISAHQQHDVEPTTFGTDSDKTRGFVNNIVLDTPGSVNGQSGISQNRNSNPTTATGHVFINRANHTQVDAELLKILYKWTNRETVAGKRIAELLRAAGFGKYVDEQKSNFIGYEELEIDIVDINATADGVNTAVGANSALGEYVGKGVGVTKPESRKTFSFDNDEFGFWVTLSAIIPESGYCQGFDPLTEVTSADQFYSQEFDAVGYELESNDIVIGETPWQNPRDSGEVQAYSETFGGVPRHTKWKVKQNIVNGDIDLKSTRIGNLPFMLDKFISLGDRTCTLVSPPGSSSRSYRALKSLGVNYLPVAGEPWRYLNRYQWLNNFVRIFADFGTDSERLQRVLTGALSPDKYEYIHYQKDHFNVFNWFDFVTYSGMKPIAESFGTTDENDGNGDTVMSRA